MKKMELVFIPAPAISHLVSHFDFAKQLLDRDDCFSVTIIVMRNPIYGNVVDYAESLVASDSRVRLRFFFLRPREVAQPQPSLPRSGLPLLIDCIESYKLDVKEFIINQVLLDSSISFAGLFVDMCTTSMIDVANELGLPSYTFCTTGAACSLGFAIYVITRHGRVEREFQASDTEI
ncbi:hypothetical protein COLO4_06562 [Corchorus olitorius]|uniref:UDP-glucuronosyl/UDP-glucosyltransferase n=1 Tax=Corchorus olitorius TaxID=93759 RepID=A0A1R3KMP9_9ROSI|nr:hypothetical protein COLO4_06562 [Corchorus olitorius]